MKCKVLNLTCVVFLSKLFSMNVIIRKQSERNPNCGTFYKQLRLFKSRNFMKNKRQLNYCRLKDTKDT